MDDYKQHVSDRKHIVRFHLDDHNWIEVSFDGDKLSLMGSGSLVILPHVANVIKVANKPLFASDFPKTAISESIERDVTAQIRNLFAEARAVTK